VKNLEGTKENNGLHYLVIKENIVKKTKNRYPNGATAVKEKYCVPPYIAWWGFGQFLAIWTTFVAFLFRMVHAGKSMVYLNFSCIFSCMEPLFC